jgi:hypothetical protein
VRSSRTVPVRRFAAEQLDHSGDRVGSLLAEALIGSAAQPYLDSRPARAHVRFPARGALPGTPGRKARGRRGRGGRTRALTPAEPHGRGRRHRGRAVLATGLGVVTGVLVVATVVNRLWADGGPVRPDRAAPRATPGPLVPGAGSSPAPAPRGFTTQLRSAETGLCLDLRDRRTGLGTEAAMVVCAQSATQEWRYEQDGLLRSGAAPGLCLNSHQLDGVLVLRPCAESPADSEDVRYELTPEGTLIPRWNDALAVVPSSVEAGAAAVVKVRDGSGGQQWETDQGSPPRTGGETPGTGGAGPAPSTLSAPATRVEEEGNLAQSPGGDPALVPGAGRGTTPQGA